MAGISKAYANLFAALPYPSLLLKEQTVALCNAHARNLLPALEEGAAADRLPFPLPDADGCGTAVIAGRVFRLDSKTTADGLILLTLIPDSAPSAPLSDPRWEALTEQLRFQLSELFTASDVLTPIVSGLDAEAADNSLAMLNRALYRLLRLTRHVELSQRPDMDYTPAVFDLAGFCRQFCAEAAPLVQMAGTELAYRPAADTLLVTGDERLLHLALLSLLSNAVKAAGKGGQVVLTLARSGLQANLSLSGSGAGVAKETLAGLFDADHIPPAGGGLGLGLSLARQIVSLHGGALMAQPNDRGGLTVALSLPPAPADAPLSVRSPGPDREGGFSPLLVELSDVLPAAAFTPIDLE